MKIRLLSVAGLFLLFTLDLQISPVLAQGTGFTYQGRLTQNGTAFNGVGQFKFALVTATNFNHQATAAANAPSGGFVTVINVTYGGNGYPTPPAVTISGGGGSGATATASVGGGAVTGVTVSNPGSGYTSTPVVIIAPPPPNIVYTKYWNNDNSSTDEPLAAVSVPVNGGRFTVLLGDTTLPNMAALNASVFSQPNLQLRLWFSDGSTGFAALDPAQPLTPAPYAIAANRAAAATNLLGTLPTAQLSGTLPSAQLSGNYSGALTFSNPANQFSGNGSGLVGLNAGSLATGKLPDARLSGNVALLSGSQNDFFGTVSAGASAPYAYAFFGQADTPTAFGGVFRYGIDGNNCAYLGGNGVCADLYGAVNVNGGPLTCVNADLHWGSGAYLRNEQGGVVELGNSLAVGAVPYIDFHYGGGTAQDYNMRIINDANNHLTVFSSADPSNYLIGMKPGGLWVNGSVYPSSDRNLKQSFRPVDSQAILEKVVALPITSWNFKNDPETPHLGPMAQDFHAAFGLGPDDKTISTLDEGGVTLAALQGLNQKVEAQAARIKEQENDLRQLHQLVARLQEALMKAAPGGQRTAQ